MKLGRLNIATLLPQTKGWHLGDMPGVIFSTDERYPWEGFPLDDLCGNHIQRQRRPDHAYISVFIETIFVDTPFQALSAQGIITSLYVWEHI